MKLKFPQQIVVIDDDPTFTNLAKKKFETLRCFVVHSFNRPQEALNFIADHQVRFVVTDINMPELSGDKILAKLKEFPFAISTAVISNTTSFASALKCYNLGADVYIKPVRSEIFLEIAESFRTRILKWNICVDSIQKTSIRGNNNRTIEKTPKDLKQFNILIVEDNEDILEYAKDYLEETFTIRTAKNGLEALNLLHGSQLIITDINMPVMDGFKLIEHVEADPNLHIPIIVVSGFLEGNSFAKSPLEIIVMEKPYGLDQLEKNINTLLKLNT